MYVSRSYARFSLSVLDIMEDETLVSRAGGVVNKEHNIIKNELNSYGGGKYLNC